MFNNNYNGFNDDLINFNSVTISRNANVEKIMELNVNTGAGPDGDKKDIVNYRPITILNVFSKLLESIVFDQF